MATKIVTKNSSTAGAAPTAIDLVQGELAVNVADKRLYTEDSVGGIVELGTNPSAEIVANGGIALPDNGKAIFGAGSDLQIYHDGSDSVIAETGTGNLALWGNNIKLLNAGGTETMLDADPNGAVTLYYNDVTRLATSGAGIDVTGDITLGDSSPAITFNDSSIVNLSHTVSSASDNLRLSVDVNGVDAGSRVEIFDGSTEVARFSAGSMLLTGTATMDGLTVDGDAVIASAVPRLILSETDVTNGNWDFRGSFGNLTIRSLNDDLSTAATKMLIGANGDIAFYEDTGTTAKFFWDASAESLSVPTLSITDGSITTTAAAGDHTVFNSTGADADFRVRTGVNTHSLYVEGNTGNVGIGTSSPSSYVSSGSNLVIAGSAGSGMTIASGTGSAGNLFFADGTVTDSAYRGYVQYNHSTDSLQLGTAATERMRIDSAGNLLVGKTSPAISSTGVELRPNGQLFATQSANYSLLLNRTTSDGAIAEFRRDGTTVGSIASSGGDSLIIQGTATGSGLIFHNSVAILPARNNAAVDNLIDLGRIAQRFNDAYVTNGVTTGSDGNYKQDIEELNAAETAVAIACKGLLRKWRWIDAVEAKGADARIHFGIIAQDLQAAFEAEGLDAGRYAMFMSNTWWEIQTEVDAVEAVEEVTDEEGNVTTEAVEAKDAYTRTDTFATLEEAPEGATERTRLGIRYSELLAFIIAAI